MEYTSKDGFPYYFELAKNGTLQSVFSEIAMFSFLHTIDEERTNYRYEPDKWSVKQVVGHIIDHEKIKMFRAFQLSRNENIELWGYDQERLVKEGRFNELSLQSLLTDFVNVRKASMSFIDGLSQEQLLRKGFARKYEVTLEQFLRSIIGHERHHLNVLKEKYGVVFSE